MEQYNTEKHVTKFIFEKIDHFHIGEYRQKVSANIIMKELQIEIINSRNTIIAVHGFSLDNKMGSLLPFIRWDEFEKTRDVSGWDLENDGYRDGWGYKFICINESGKSMITNYLDVTFHKKEKPAYEKLLSWIINNYSNSRLLKEYNLFW